MFRGTYEHTLDKKGRVSVPKKYREELTEGGEAQEVVLTRGLQRNLELYPAARWAEIEEKIISKSQFDPDVIRAKRILVAGAMECTLDGQGRILIPPAMRAYAGLEKEVTWVGQLTKIEIWSQDAWEKAHVDALRDDAVPVTIDDGFARALANLGL